MKTWSYQIEMETCCYWQLIFTLIYTYFKMQSKTPISNQPKGSRFKSSSSIHIGISFSRLALEPLSPRNAMTVVFRNSNLNLFLMNETASEYLCPVATSILWASPLTRRWASTPITPDVENTSGVKVPFSTPELLHYTSSSAHLRVRGTSVGTVWLHW